MISLNFTIFLVFFSPPSLFYPIGCWIHFKYLIKNIESVFNYLIFHLKRPLFPPMIV